MNILLRCILSVIESQVKRSIHDIHFCKAKNDAKTLPIISFTVPYKIPCKEFLFSFVPGEKKKPNLSSLRNALFFPL